MTRVHVALAVASLPNRRARRTSRGGVTVTSSLSEPVGKHAIIYVKCHHPARR